ncbi:MAG: phosphotransferase, partial [bacterium]
ASSVVLRDAIVAGGSIIDGAGARLVLCAASITSDPAIPAALQALGWPAAKTMALHLPPRASARSFVRLVYGARRAMLICYSDERHENLHYASYSRFLLRHGIPVARVLADHPGSHFLVVEDLGCQSLELLATQIPPAALEAVYQRVLDGVGRLHAIPSAALTTAALVLQPAFGPDLYKWEREYFAEHYLRGHLRLSAAAIRPLLSDLEHVARMLSQAPPVLVHRDLQSSNLLLRRGRPYLIDFQGMRFGAAAYDLASLLADPYVMLPEPMQRRLLAYYVRRSGGAINETLFWLGAVERLAQALGAFARLSSLPGMARFRAYLPRGERMLRRALCHTPDLLRLRAVIDPPDRRQRKINPRDTP